MVDRRATCQVAASSRQTLCCRESPHGPSATVHSTGADQTGSRRTVAAAAERTAVTVAPPLRNAGAGALK